MSARAFDSREKAITVCSHARERNVVLDGRYAHTHVYIQALRFSFFLFIFSSLARIGVAWRRDEGKHVRVFVVVLS